MRLLFVLAVLIMAAAVVAATADARPDYIENAGGVIAIVSGLGAAKLYFDTQSALEAERDLKDLRDFVTSERSEEIALGIRRRDRMTQLTLIGVSALGSAVQPFATEITDCAALVGRTMASLLQLG